MGIRVLRLGATSLALLVLAAGCVPEKNPNNTADQSEANNRYRLELGQTFDGVGNLTRSDDVDQWSFRTDTGTLAVGGLLSAHSKISVEILHCKLPGGTAGEVYCDQWEVRASTIVDNLGGNDAISWVLPQTVATTKYVAVGCFVYLWVGCSPPYLGNERAFVRARIKRDPATAGEVTYGLRVAHY